jgi:hypothetical protein
MSKFQANLMDREAFQPLVENVLDEALAKSLAYDLINKDYHAAVLMVMDNVERFIWNAGLLLEHPTSEYSDGEWEKMRDDWLQQTYEYRQQIEARIADELEEDQ